MTGNRKRIGGCSAWQQSGEPVLRLKALALGLVAAAGLLGFYLAVITVLQDGAHALVRLRARRLTDRVFDPIVASNAVNTLKGG